MKKVSLLNPPWTQLALGGLHARLTRQGTVEASTCGGADAYLLEQQLDGCLALVDSLRMTMMICVAVIPSVDKALCRLGAFAFVALHLFSVDGRHL